MQENTTWKRAKEATTLSRFMTKWTMLWAMKSAGTEILITKEVNEMIPIRGVLGMIPVIYECSKCKDKEECDIQEYKDQGYCFSYKDRED